MQPGPWCDSLRMLVVGGEAPSPDKLRQWTRLVGPRPFVNVYGPTEATIATTAYLVKGDEPAAPLAKIPIGRPLGNVQVYLLDPNLQPVPIGVPGEMHIGGAGLARGCTSGQALSGGAMLSVGSRAFMMMVFAGGYP